MKFDVHQNALRPNRSTISARFSEAGDAMTTYLRMPIVFALGVILPVAVVVLILMR